MVDKMLNIIGIGDNVCDKYRNLNMMFPGGQALNFAVYCKQMGMNSSYIGVFGNDNVAKHVIKTLNELDVDISHSRYVDGENGYAIVDVVGGDRVFVTSNKGGVLKTNPIILSVGDLEFLKKFQIIHTSNNSYFDNQLDKLSELVGYVSYDFSTSWSYDERAENICRNADFVFLSCSNLDKNEIKERLLFSHKYGADVVIATMGSKGSVVYDGYTFFTSEPKIVKAVDTLGAGDSFAAAFITSYVSNIGKKRYETMGIDQYSNLVYECLDNANKKSANTCMSMGAFGYGSKISD